LPPPYITVKSTPRSLAALWAIKVVKSQKGLPSLSGLIKTTLISAEAENARQVKVSRAQKQSELIDFLIMYLPVMINVNYKI